MKKWIARLFAGLVAVGGFSFAAPFAAQAACNGDQGLVTGIISDDEGESTDLPAPFDCL